MSAYKEKIERLAVICAEKEMTERTLGMGNTPSDYSEAQLALQEYAIARAETFRARLDLVAALGEE